MGLLEYFLISRAQSNAESASMRAQYAGADAASAKAEAQSARREMVQLEQRIASMELAVEALVRTLVRSGRMTEEEFLRVAREVDMEDGVLDGRRAPVVNHKSCPSCQRASSPDRTNCMWCGASLAGQRPKTFVL